MGPRTIIAIARFYVSHCLKLLERGYIGIIQGSSVGAMKEGTRSLDYSLFESEVANLQWQ